MDELEIYFIYSVLVLHFPIKLLLDPEYYFLETGPFRPPQFIYCQEGHVAVIEQWPAAVFLGLV